MRPSPPQIRQSSPSMGPPLGCRSWKGRPDGFHGPDRTRGRSPERVSWPRRPRPGMLTSPIRMTFAELGLSKKCLAALEREGFEAPTPIQSQAIPPALLGKDVVGSAATGTGQTLAFVLPILERLEGKHGTRALILAPTRELALQIDEQVERFRHGHHLRSAAVTGR